jgi:hypothetical protein
MLLAFVCSAAWPISPSTDTPRALANIIIG